MILVHGRTTIVLCWVVFLLLLSENVADNGTEAELGHKPHQISRSTQTSAFMYSGCDQTVRVCDNYTRVDLRINEKAAQYLASSGYRTEHIESKFCKRK